MVPSQQKSEVDSWMRSNRMRQKVVMCRMAVVGSLWMSVVDVYWALSDLAFSLQERSAVLSYGCFAE